VWSSGDRIIYREVVHGKVWTVRPVIIIQDTRELIALFVRNHTAWKVCAPPDAETDLLLCKAGLRPWQLNDVVWTYGDTVILAWPETAHAVHVMWDQQRRFAGWYINMQEPVKRTRLGFDFLDQELDIVVSPDLSWRWKDRDHLERAKAIGLFSVEQVRAILAEGQHVVDQIRARAMPSFDGSWSSWMPPSDWDTPCLPEEWHEVG